MTGPLPQEREVAVVGAGAMGAGIALVAASAGHRVRLYDAQPSAVANALGRLAGDLQRLVARGKLDNAEAEARLARIVAADNLDDLAGAGLVVEAIVEDLAAKADVLGRLAQLLPGDSILATNTSSLSVTALAARLPRPGQVVGMHFFNPPPAMPLVEVVSGTQTDAAVAETVFETARSWSKTPVHCASTPGFIVNRVARPFYAEAFRLLADRAAAPATIDALMREAGGFRMGPLELTDLIGHDVNFAVTSSVHEAFFHDPRYEPSLVQRALVEAGRLGRKSGQGFYRYGDEAETPAPVTAAAGPKPSEVRIAGDLGPAAAVPELLARAGVRIVREDGPGLLRLDGVDIGLTDGRTATERAVESGRPTAVFDLCLDYERASRVGVAVSAGCTRDQAGRAYGVFQALGKAVSPFDDVAGLAVARTVAMLINEAADAVQQGLAEPREVDLAMEKGANYPIGPLAWGDRLGARWVLAVLDGLARACPSGRYRPSPLLRRNALAGLSFSLA